MSDRCGTKATDLLTQGCFFWNRRREGALPVTDFESEPYSWRGKALLGRAFTALGKRTNKEWFLNFSRCVVLGGDI
jgi:hypothetical protein